MANISLTHLKNFQALIVGQYAEAAPATIGSGIACGLVAVDMAFQAIKQTLEMVQVREWVEVHPHLNRIKAQGHNVAPVDAAADDASVDEDWNDANSEDAASQHPVSIKSSIPIRRVVMLAGNIQGALFYSACAANILPGAAMFGAGLLIIHSQKFYSFALPHEHLDHSNETFIKKFFFLQIESLHAIHEYITAPKDYNLLVTILTYAVIPALRKITDIFKAVYNYSVNKVSLDLTTAFTYIQANKRKIAFYCGLSVASAYSISQLLAPKYFAVNHLR